MGPVTIFDKSALQALNQDEAVWFDQFLCGNITPIFYIETLADLEKEVQAGKTPEQVVGAIAAKTPLEAFPNVYHYEIILQELAGNPQILDGRPLISPGVPKKTPEGKITIHFDQFPEAAALSRWQRGDFEDIEREVAKGWRQDLLRHDPVQEIAKVINILPANGNFSSLASIKTFIDEFCHASDKPTLQLMMDILNIPSLGRPKVIRRWEQTGKPLIDTFAPYSVHVFKVDLLYCLGMAKGFIADTRASNRVDMAYLYYLPFANVFVSNDNLHKRTVPLFENDFERPLSFIMGSTLKEALKEINAHYEKLPDAIKARGVMRFAISPPSQLNNVVSQLWDKYMVSNWRDLARNEEADLLDHDKEPDWGSAQPIIDTMENSTPIDRPNGYVPEKDVDAIYVQRFVPARRGKWRLISEEIEKGIQNGKNAKSHQEKDI